MARLKNANKALKYDKRLAKYNLSNGVISQEEHDKSINDLVDVQDRSEPLTLENETSAAPIVNTEPVPVAPSAPSFDSDSDSGFGGSGQSEY